MKRGLRILLGRNRCRIYGPRGQGVRPARQRFMREVGSLHKMHYSFSHKCLHCVNNATDHNNDCKLTLKVFFGSGIVLITLCAFGLRLFCYREN